MSTLRLLTTPENTRHNGEVFGCSYTPDGAFVLTAGWDGHLRLWEATSGTHLTALPVCGKPLSTCAVSPNGKRWIAGSMEGLLTFWDAHTHLLQSQAVVHTRPISCLRYSPDGRLLASTSWDRQLSLRCLERDRDSRAFTAHEDIVAGCRFSPDGRSMLTWSHDRTLKTWDILSNRETAKLVGHRDRVTAADVSPDGQFAVSGSRSGELILWQLDGNKPAGTVKLGAEVRGCFFLPDVSAVLVAEASGRLHVLTLPDLQLQVQLALRQPIQCGALSPTGQQLALGGEDGLVRFVAIEDSEQRPLVVTATQSVRQTASRLQKWFGRSTRTFVYSCTCPACHKGVERLGSLTSEPFPCSHCQRPLRFNGQPFVLHQTPC